MLNKINLWAHRLWMIMALPFAIVFGILFGPLMAFEIIYEKFKEYWG